MQSLEYLKGFRDGLARASVGSAVTASITKVADKVLADKVAEIEEQINTLLKQSKESPDYCSESQLPSSHTKQERTPQT